MDWTWKSIVFEVPWYTNYFWGLIAISLGVWLLEIALPWRKKQSNIRRDFWLDAFYMFFNFFILGIGKKVLENSQKQELLYANKLIYERFKVAVDVARSTQPRQYLLFFPILQFIITLWKWKAVSQTRLNH